MRDLINKETKFTFNMDLSKTLWQNENEKCL